LSFTHLAEDPLVDLQHGSDSLLFGQVVAIKDELGPQPGAEDRHLELPHRQRPGLAQLDRVDDPALHAPLRVHHPDCGGRRPVVERELNGGVPDVAWVEPEWRIDEVDLALDALGVGEQEAAPAASGCAEPLRDGAAAWQPPTSLAERVRRAEIHTRGARERRNGFVLRAQFVGGLSARGHRPFVRQTRSLLFPSTSPDVKAVKMALHSDFDPIRKACAPGYVIHDASRRSSVSGARIALWRAFDSA